MMVIAIPIPQQTRFDAIRLVEFRRNEARKNGCSPKFQTNVKENELIGLLGEECFEAYLIQQGIAYVRNVVHGEADTGDFIINGKIIEVKTGHLKYDFETTINNGKYKFFIAEQQLSEFRDYYVNIQIDKEMENAYITGFIHNDAIKNYPILNTANMSNPAKAIPLPDLTSIKLFKGVVTL